MPQGRHLQVQAGPGIAARGGIAEVVQGASGRLPHDGVWSVFQERVYSHESGAERLAAREEVELLPRSVIRALDELLDHEIQFAAIAAEVVTPIQNQVARPELVHLPQDSLKELNEVVVSH